MDIGHLVSELFFDYTLRTVALGSAVLGVVSGVLGSFAVLRKQSLLGDAISHAALPGIALAFLFTGSKAPLVLIAGALAAGWLGTLFMMIVVRHSRLKSDAALGLVLSVFFGFGLVLLTFIQKRPDATQAGLDKFLFGQAAALMERDVVTMAVLGAVALLVLGLFWKEFKILCFDYEYASSQGFPVRFLDLLLITLLVLAIILGLQTVGVVLMSAMVVAPAAAARQWTDRLELMVLLAAFFGAVSGIMGAVISSTTARLPTGPTVVLCVSVLVVISMLGAPNRGILWRNWRQMRNRRRLAAEAVLCDLYELDLQHANPDHGHSPAVLRTMNVLSAGAERSLEKLRGQGLARTGPSGGWTLTQTGRSAARRLIFERKGDHQ